MATNAAPHSYSVLWQGALSRLARDSQAVKNPGLPRSLVRAIQRRRMLERKGKGAVCECAVLLVTVVVNLIKSHWLWLNPC
jgi:hypothetical protein